RRSRTRSWVRRKRSDAVHHAQPGPTNGSLAVERLPFPRVPGLQLAQPRIDLRPHVEVAPRLALGDAKLLDRGEQPAVERIVLGHGAPGRHRLARAEARLGQHAPEGGIVAVATHLR